MANQEEVDREGKKVDCNHQGLFGERKRQHVHTLHLLTAEFNVLKSNFVEAEESYKQAQTSAKRTGFVKDRALAHELAGVYYLGKNDEYWAKHNMTSAHQAYTDWQARVKADHLKRRYPQFFSGENNGF